MRNIVRKNRGIVKKTFSKLGNPKKGCYFYRKIEEDTLFFFDTE